MNVGDNRHRRGAHDGGQGVRRVLVGARHPDDIGARIGQRLHLGRGRGHVPGRCVGHRLDSDRGVATHGDGADLNLAAAPAINVAIGSYAHGRSSRDRAPIRALYEVFRGPRQKAGDDFRVANERRSRPEAARDQATHCAGWRRSCREARCRSHRRPPSGRPHCRSSSTGRCDRARDSGHPCAGCG